jgi:DNA-binding MarR family transcriptional regulator
MVRAMTVRNDNFPVMRPTLQVIREHARKYPGVDMQAIETLIQFARVGSQFFAAADIFFSRFGISRARFAVLVTLAQTPEGFTPAQLADGLEVSRATMTGLLDTLERAHHVERRDDPTDRRSYTVVITQQGMAFLDEILPANWQRAKNMMKGLSARERSELLRLLGKLEAGVAETRAADAARLPRKKA